MRLRIRKESLVTLIASALDRCGVTMVAGAREEIVSAIAKAIVDVEYTDEMDQWQEAQIAKAIQIMRALKAYTKGG
jgi:hypothetical protein